jgi:hypothetical protein
MNGFGRSGMDKSGDTIHLQFTNYSSQKKRKTMIGIFYLEVLVSKQKKQEYKSDVQEREISFF